MDTGQLQSNGELPFFFADRRTPVMLEPIFLPLILILIAMVLGFCLILPGIRGRERIFAALRFLMLGSAGLWIFFRCPFLFALTPILIDNCLVFSARNGSQLQHDQQCNCSVTIVSLLSPISNFSWVSSRRISP